MISRKKTKQNMMGTKSVTVILSVALFLLIWSLYKEVKGQQQIRNEVVGLENEYALLKEQNLKLVKQLKYFQTNEFVEREAREKLNMAKKGEHVVLVTRREGGDLKIANKSKELKNWQLWVKYFFSGNK